MVEAKGLLALLSPTIDHHSKVIDHLVNSEKRCVVVMALIL